MERGAAGEPEEGISERGGERGEEEVLGIRESRCVHTCRSHGEREEWVSEPGIEEAALCRKLDEGLGMRMDRGGGPPLGAPSKDCEMHLGCRFLAEQEDSKVRGFFHSFGVGEDQAFMFTSLHVQIDWTDCCSVTLFDTRIEYVK